MSQVTNNAETPTRTEEKGLNVDVDTRWCRDAGNQSENIGNQQERTYRAYSSKSSISSSGASDDGGMVCQLIDDYRDQVAARKAEIKRLEDEVKKLEFRIDEFEILKHELNQEPLQVE
ncbi:MAG: hypothetical protein ACR2LR_13095 [Hassallia sp.]